MFKFYFRFIHTRFISLNALNSASLPLVPDEFEKYVKQKCLEQRELLEKSWIPKCAKKILELKEYWKHLVPLGDDESLELPMKFFASISAEMSNQLRNMVVDSLEEFVLFFEQYKVSYFVFKKIYEIFSSKNFLCSIEGRQLL